MRLGQLRKCHILMERMSVEGTGIDRQVRRKVERSDFVALDCMDLQERFCGLLVFWAGVGCFGARGFIYRPSVRLHWPVMIMLPYLIVFTFYLEKLALQL